MYHVLEMDLEQAVMAAFEEARPGHDLKWLEGRLFGPDERPESPAVTLSEVYDDFDEPGDPQEELPDFFELMRVCVGSQRFRAALTAAGVANVEYYPVVIRSSPPREIGSYFALNVVGRVACMDMDRSDYTVHDGRVARIHSLALDEGAIHGLTIFRLHELPEIILVAQRVADALRDLQGVSLLPAEGWSDEHRF